MSEPAVEKPIRRRRPRQDLPEWIEADQKAHDGTGPWFHCGGRWEEYALYDVPPTAEEAKAMCEPCPLRAICLKNARHLRHEWGVYGGVVFKPKAQKPKYN